MVQLKHINRLSKPLNYTKISEVNVTNLNYRPKKDKNNNNNQIRKLRFFFFLVKNWETKVDQP